jgi:peptidoglycan/LPS O-acetylase OafA/YrhL
MPAQICPWCRVELKKATEPKRKKPPLWRTLVNLVVIIICALVIYFLFQELMERKAFDSMHKFIHAIEFKAPAWREAPLRVPSLGEALSAPQVAWPISSKPF